MAIQQEIQRGDIIRINLNPTTGREQTGETRPCLVLSHTQFNQVRNGIVIVSPITRSVKLAIKTMIPLPEGFKIQGSIIAEQIRTLDLSQRWWKPTGEQLPDTFVDTVVATLNVIIG
ncbi:MAG: type II toxin-antitoxin system PemK/MazF family toxin [Leptolyngbya sp. RL_3_1]|nr:type II toxin-antitoxin system PemK/MazF family toxin [Leptolyngbya sp. RL_3_1]